MSAARRSPAGRPTANRGFAAARAQALDSRAQHQLWLDLVEVSGPFLSMPVLRRVWSPLDALDREHRSRLREQHAEWQADTVAGRDEWAAYLLRELLEWGDALTLRQGEAEDLLLDRFTVEVPEHGAVLRADFALTEPGTDPASEAEVTAAAKQTRVLGVLLPAGTHPTARPVGQAGGEWSASPADRMARLLRHHGIELGLVSDGRWWCLVWAPLGGVTTTAVFDTVTWNEAEERTVVRAWVSLLRRGRFFQYPDAETLVGLLAESIQAGEEVTDALGVQVRQAVELLVEAIGRADAEAQAAGGAGSAGAGAGGAGGLHAAGVYAGDVYRGAVAVMMRVVFLLFAEERGLLPVDNEVYAASYSARTLRAELRARADREGEFALRETTDGWHRLIALFHAVHGGVDHPELKLPAYDGSIFDPTTYGWLEQGAPLLPIDDLTVLHMLRAVQEVRVGTGKQQERRTLSFRALDVEQIGYVYEGLLSYGGQRATEHMVGLIGPDGLEHEVPLRELEALSAGVGGDPAKLAEKVHAAYKDPKPPDTVRNLTKLLAAPQGEAAARARDLVHAACRDVELTERLLPFAGILRSDLRGLPVVIPAGAMYVTDSSLRKNTGTHYTPRSLAEEVVEHALQPLVYEVGPLQTADADTWVPKSAERILELRVADIAMGSGAFLVGACRYLGARLIEAWAREGAEAAVRYRAGRENDAVTAADAESDPVVVEARRQVIEHCLYGVDINPMAVEMAKLSLWLVSMDPDRPFTFMDDRVVAGDSLLGVTSLEQLAAVHMVPARAGLEVGLADTEALVARLVAERQEITAISGDDLEAVDAKRARLAAVRRHTERLRLVGDLVSGAALATCASGRVEWYAADGSGERVRDVFPEAAVLAARVDAKRAVEDEVVAEVQGQAKAWLASELPAGGMERVPVHWPLEFPEVFAGGRGGFDAVVGNPPFLGGQKLTGALGEAFREYLVEYVAGGVRGSADLVAYFELRVHELLGGGGQSGIIATNTLAQGDSREVGLDQLERDGVTIRRAIKSAPWPSRSAVLEYCAVWTSVGEVGDGAVRELGGLVVRNGISTSLNPGTREESWVEGLKCNADISFQGSTVLGLGFTLPESEAREWIAEDPRCGQVLFPYLNGQDVNNDPSHGSDRWVINFGIMGRADAEHFARPFKQVLDRVMPERALNNRKVYRDYWWQYAEKRPSMIASLEGLERCIVIALVSKSVMPAMVPTGQVFSHMLGVFASDDPALLAILSSAPHYWWAIDRASTMKGDLRYTPSDVFETLVRPPLTAPLRAAGTRLDTFRRNLMLGRTMGLTTTYNLVHDPACQDPEIAELRAIHVEIDRVTLAAYGWTDLLDDSGATPPADPTHETGPLDHGFHETDQGTRYTIGLLARTEIIDRLRQLNHQTYVDECHLGLHKKPKKHPGAPDPSPEAKRLVATGRAKPAATAGTGAFDGLFPPDDALF